MSAILTYADINEEFTGVVKSYLRRGYVINTSTFSSHNGNEIAHVDVTDGAKIIRVFLQHFVEVIGFDCLGGLEVIAGEVPADEATPNGNDIGEIIWNKHLTEITRDRFYGFGAKYRKKEVYGTKEDALHAEQKRYARLLRKNEQEPKPHAFESDRAYRIAGLYIRKKFDKKRVARSDTKIYRGRDYGSYVIVYRNKVNVLK